MPDWKPGDFIAGPGGGRVESPDWEPRKERNDGPGEVVAVVFMIVIVLIFFLFSTTSRNTGGSKVSKTEETQWSEVRGPVLAAIGQYRKAEFAGDQDEMARVTTAIQPICAHAYSLSEPKRERVKVQRNDTLTACSAMKLG